MALDFITCSPSSHRHGAWRIGAAVALLLHAAAHGQGGGELEAPAADQWEGHSRLCTPGNRAASLNCCCPLSARLGAKSISGPAMHRCHLCTGRVCELSSGGRPPGARASERAQDGEGCLVAGSSTVVTCEPHHVNGWKLTALPEFESTGWCLLHHPCLHPQACRPCSLVPPASAPCCRRSVA